MGASPVVLCYHAIGSVPKSQRLYNAFVPIETFEAHLDFLVRRRKVVSVAEAVAGQAGRGAVAITFDDAYRSVLELAAPALRSRDLPATVFVPTRWIGQRNEWDDLPAGPYGIMTSEELLQARAAGLELASHGHAHIDLGAANADAAREDLRASVDVLTELTGEHPRFLAYPFGSHSEAAREATADLGFQAAFSLEATAGRMAIERVAVYPADRGPLFAFKTSGRYLSFRRAPIVTHGYSLVRPVLRRERLWR